MLSVIIITRNRLNKLKRCIDSVREKCRSAEIIVVDNGSSDGTREYIENASMDNRSDCSMKCIFNERNLGWAKGRNIGIKESKGDYIMFLDDDAWIDSLDLSDIENYFNSNKDVGIIAPRIFYPSGVIQESVRAFPTLKALFWRGIGLHKLFPNVSWYKRYIQSDLLNTRNVREIDWAIGACQIISRKVFNNIGLLDEKFFYYEDAEFCLRAKRAGYSTVYWPHATIYHEYARTSSKGINRAFFRHLVSIMRFFLVFRVSEGSPRRVDL